jgi:hypothetical protein
MTTMAMNETRGGDGRRDADYETFLRVRNGISNEALRAAGLPPAQELTFEAYLDAFGPKKPRAQDDLERPRGADIDRLRIAPTVPPSAIEEPPAPPPLGRRLILDEAPDGTWRIVADPDTLTRATRPRRARPLAKLLAMAMGLACAFVIAATLNAVLLHKDHWRLAVDPAARPESAETRKGAADRVIIEARTKDDKAPSTFVVEPIEGLQINTASGAASEAGAAAADRALKPLPEVDVSTKAAHPVPAPEPTPQRVAPADLPRSTPTTRQLKLPSSTKPASVP